MLLSLHFCLSVKVLISPLNLNDILAGYSNLGCRFFPFITLNMSCHSLLSCRGSAERSDVNLMGIPLYVICCFSHAAFNIFSLYLIFDILINNALVCFSLDLSCMGLSALRRLDHFLSHIKEVFNYNLFKYFLSPFLFLYFFCDPYNFVHLMLSQSSLRLSSFLFILFSLFCSVVIISTILSSR